jgi:multiple sugar transport system ATP-binding protein/alpha-glucoside transport system ATP-binding protein
MFVAGFIGSPKMNFFNETNLEKNVSIIVEGAEDKDTIGIRPEHLRRCKARDAIISAKLDLIENLGENLLVHCIASDGTEFITKMESAPTEEIGETICFDAPADRIHLFDGMSTRRKTH